MNAVIYARYSSHGQTEQSIEGQLHDNYEWAERQGITVIAEYIDRALTGTKDQRPDFQRMIADAAKKQFDMVIVWKLDRFARNRYDSAIYKSKLKKYGVKVVSVKENITDSPEGIILEGLLESMAEYYSANLSQNVKRGLRENVSKGLYCGGNIPFGYKAVDKRLVIDEKTAPIIRLVFERYAAGVTKKQIVAELTEKGYRARNGKPFTYHSFSAALKNTVYIGEYSYDGVKVEGTAERMISDELFYKVQQRLKLTARAPAASKAKVDYLLQGKAFCGECGASLIGESGRSHTGGKYYYYTCAVKKKTHACKKKNERKDFLEWYIAEQTAQYVLDDARAAVIADAVVKEYNKEFSDSSVSVLEKSIAQIETDLNKLVDALIDCPPSAKNRIYEKMESLEAQKSDLESEAARLRVAQKIGLTRQEVLAWLSTFRGGNPSNPEYQKRLIDAFINSVYVYDNRIIIFYNIRGGKQISYLDLAASIASDSFSPPDPSSQKSSDLKHHAVPLVMKSEPAYFFVDGILGFVFRK